MVAPTWLLMSSPTIGKPAAVNRAAHSGSLAMNTGIALTNHPGVEACLRVEALRLLRADGQVAHEHVGAAVPEHVGDVDRVTRRLLDLLAVVVAEAVEGRGVAPRRRGARCWRT